MKHFGKNRFFSFFALLLVLVMALSINSVFAAETTTTGTDSAVQQESGTKSRTETGRFCFPGKPGHPGTDKKNGLDYGQQ